MKECKIGLESGAFLVNQDGAIWGIEDTTRLDALVWYKRLWAKMSKRYREKYIDLKPIKEVLEEGITIYINENL